MNLFTLRIVAFYEQCVVVFSLVFMVIYNSLHFHVVSVYIVNITSFHFIGSFKSLARKLRFYYKILHRTVNTLNLFYTIKQLQGNFRLTNH